MITNRDLYKLVTGFETERSLEGYLRALWRLGLSKRDELIDASDIMELLQRALVEEPPAFEDGWRDQFVDAPTPTGELVVDWERTILFQIVELRTMAEDGVLDDKYKYLGVQSASGATWYNFDVVTYLECGVRGSVGGYEEDEVVVLIPDPEGNDSPVFDLVDFGWEEFTDLLWCGQYYE